MSFTLMLINDMLHCNVGCNMVHAIKLHGQKVLSYLSYDELTPVM